MTMNSKDICLINASNPLNTSIEWDEYVDYREGVVEIFKDARPTKMFRSWHSIPCCLETEFFVYGKPKFEGVYRYKGVIVLVNRDLHAVEPLIKKLKLMGKKVVVAWHENFADFLISSMDPNWIVKFFDLIKMTDGQWSCMPAANSFFASFHNKPIHECMMAIPWTEWKHGLTVPEEQREGIIVGTRTLNQRIVRNTWAALATVQKAAQELNTFATYLNEDGFDLKPFLDKLGFDRIRVMKGPMPTYEDWLSLIAKHRVLYHADMAGSLGQVITDALLMNVLSLGSNSDNNVIGNTASRDVRVIAAEAEKLKNLYNLYKIKYFNLMAESLKYLTSFENVRESTIEFFNEL